MAIRRPKSIATLVVARGQTGAPDGEEDEPHSRPLDLGLVRRMFSYARPYAAHRNWLIVCVLMRSAQLPLLGWLIGRVIQGPIAHGDLRGTMWGAAAFGMLAALTALTFHFRVRLALTLGELVIQDLRAEVFAHLQRMTMGFYHRTKLGRVISRMTSDIEAVRVGVQDVLFISLVQIGQMTLAGALMVWCDWALFCTVLAMAPAIWGINRYFSGQLSHAYRAQQESFSRITANLAESVNGIRVTQSFVRQDLNAGMFRELVADHFAVGLGAARLSAVFLPALELNSQFFISILLLLGGYRALHPEIAMPVGNLIEFFFLATLFFQPIQSLGLQYNQALTAMAGAERVFKLLDQPPDWADAPDAHPLPAGTRGRVEFRDVGFEYVPSVPVLSAVSFTAAAGQTVALVGHTGSGKTSIINLIAKFYLPTAGTVCIDGHDLQSLTSESLHEQMAIVSQANFLFNDTIAENIRFGKPGASKQELVDVCRRLDCLDFFESLPDGLETPVGERGGGLSGGQRQLVCFARALLADPRILILDEATSAIDALTEVRLQTSLARLLTGRTSFVVAHRLSTIRHADLVLVLADGRIVERGTHLELVAENGAYAALYREFIRDDK